MFASTVMPCHSLRYSISLLTNNLNTVGRRSNCCCRSIAFKHIPDFERRTLSFPDSEGVPVKRPSDHSATAEFAANAPRNRWRVGPGWQRARALTMFIRLGEGRQRSAFEELTDSPLLTRQTSELRALPVLIDPGDADQCCGSGVWGHGSLFLLHAGFHCGHAHAREPPDYLLDQYQSAEPLAWCDFRRPSRLRALSALHRR